MKQMIGTKWDDTFEKNIFAEEEIQASNLRVAFMTELIKARSEKGITQKQLEPLTGITQPVIARMETGKTSPTLDTILKLLAPLGKTLSIVNKN